MSTQLTEAVRLIRKGRRAEARGKAMAGCITGLITDALTYLFRAWMLMLAVGIAHEDVSPAIPTLGYWQALLFVVLLAGVFSRIPPTTKPGGAS